jgi:hypothetical protein
MRLRRWNTGEAVFFAIGTGAVCALGSFAAAAGGFYAYPPAFVGERIAAFALTGGCVVAIVSMIHNWIIDWC